MPRVDIRLCGLSATASLPAIATESGQWLIGFSCPGWFDDVNRAGRFEPVGTRADHRQPGGAVPQECLRRLATLGATVAYVGCADSTPADCLYQSVGFADSDVERLWQKMF